MGKAVAVGSRSGARLGAVLVGWAVASAAGATLALAEGNFQPSYELVTHVSGAREVFLPIDNLLVVGFEPGVGEDANFELAQSEGFLARSVPEETAEHGAAIYALPPGERAPALTRLLDYPEVHHVMPALLREQNGKALFVHPGAFFVNHPPSDEGRQGALIAAIESALGAVALPVTAPTRSLRPEGPAPARPSTRLRVQVPEGKGLFQTIAAAAKIDGVAGTGIIELHSPLSDANDHYLVEEDLRTAWFILHVADGERVSSVRHNYVWLDTLVAVEYASALPAAERRKLLAKHGLAPLDPGLEELPGVLVPGLDGRVEFARCTGEAADRALAIAAEPQVVGAIPGLWKPFIELQTMRFMRPHHIVLEYPGEVRDLEITLGLRRLGLEEVTRETVRGMTQVVARTEEHDLFAVSRQVLKDVPSVFNCRPQLLLTRNEVQMVAGQDYRRGTAWLEYTDEEGDEVGLYPLDRLMVVTFAPGAPAAAIERFEDALSLRRAAIRQNLNVRDPYVVYIVRPPRSAVQLARACQSLVAAGGGSLPDGGGDLDIEVVEGVAPVLIDSDTHRQVFAPQAEVTVAFEPKTPEARVAALLQKHGLTPVADPNRPAAEDPHLDLRGDFWSYYVSRRIRLRAAAGLTGETVTALNNEPEVVWCHPTSLSPALDRGSRAYLSKVGGGWYRIPQLDVHINMLIHLTKTASPEAVRGYAARAGLPYQGERLRVVVEPHPDSSTGAVKAGCVAAGLDLDVDDGEKLFGTLTLADAERVAGVKGVGIIRAKEVFPQ